MSVEENMCLDQPNEYDEMTSANETSETHNDQSIEQRISSEIMKILEAPVTTHSSEQNHLETNIVTIKEETINAQVDYDMPIAKTPHHTSASLSEQCCDMNSVTSAVSEECHDAYMHLNNISSKSALDVYLDGLETPIAPIRVKTEFAWPQTAQGETSDGNAFTGKHNDGIIATILQPPPPIFSTTSISGLVADEVATPRISLAANNRIRIKSEFSMLQHSDTQAEGKESGDVSPKLSDDASDDEPIPEDFFDDLLHDKLKERIEEAQNNELEEKYSVRLKEYERMKNEEKLKKKNSSRKKQKKLRKKGVKRSRSQSVSLGSNINDLSGPPNCDRNKRSRISSSYTGIASRLNCDNRNETYLSVDSALKIKSEFPVNGLEYTANDAHSVENLEELEEILSPKQRREKALKRAKAVINYLKNSSDNDCNIFSTFSFVSTVRKLPISHSYVQQQIYENRSPLHTVNNVSYKFNSHMTHFNMEEWGLAALTPHAAKLAKLVGCSAKFIHDKLKTIKIPAKLKKSIIEPSANYAENEEEEVRKPTSSLYSNAMTQTDDVSEFDVGNKAKGYDIGVQVQQSMYSIGCQTLETQSPNEYFHKDDDAPIIQIIRDLNENQLMAVHSFTELIKQPNTNANAMDLYKMQMQMLDIYKMSQIPSAFVTTQNPIVNNYTTSIQNVKGADGKQFCLNDPRTKSAIYANRIVNEVPGSPLNYERRYTRFSQSSNVSASPNENYNMQTSYGRASGYISGTHESNSNSSRQWRNSPHNIKSTPTMTKHYGRGGLRR